MARNSITPPGIVLGILALVGSAVGVLGWLGVILVAAFGYYAFCLVRPAAGLAWAFAILPFATPEFQLAGINIHPFELLVWPGTLIALAAAFAKRPTFKAADARHLAPLLILSGYMIVASLLMWGDKAPLEIRMWGSALVFGLACYLMGSDDDFQRNFRRAFMTTAVGLFVLGLLQHVVGSPGFRGFEEPRDLVQLLLFGDSRPTRLANLTFDHFNSAGAYLTVVVGVLLGGSLTGKYARGLWAATLAAVCALYLTYSRGAALATFAGAVVSVYLVARTSMRRVVAVGTVAALGIAVYFLIPRLLLSDYATTVTIGSRALIWQAYVQAWLSSPLFGLGPGNGYLAAQFLSPFGELYAAHSNLLYVATDFGLMGLVAAAYGFGAVVVRAVRRSRAERQSNPYLLGAVAVVTALGVHSLVDHTLVLFSYRVALFGVVALGLRSSASSGRDNASHEGLEPVSSRRE
jgi:O-antigen ligase